MTLDEFFAGQALPRELFAAICHDVEALGDVTMRITKSQIAFRRRRNFALVWTPGKYLKGEVAPLVLTVLLPARDPSPRWKQIVEPTPGRFTHHLELHSTSTIDASVRDWLRQAWEAAG